MLSWGEVLARVKDDLLTPNTPLEKTDDEIISYLKRNVLDKWAYYFPSFNRITLNTYDEKVRVPHRTSCYYIFDPEGREVKNIKTMYDNSGSSILFGHDMYGAWSYDQVPQIALQNQMANNTLLYSAYNYIVRFYPPNICEIKPNFEGSCVIEYERAIDEELGDISPDLKDIFCELCVAMVNMWIGKLRMKFSTYQTQFGEIQLNGESMYNEGKQKYDNIIEQLKSSYMCMNTVFEHG